MGGCYTLLGEWVLHLVLHFDDCVGEFHTLLGGWVWVGATLGAALWWVWVGSML